MTIGRDIHYCVRKRPQTLFIIFYINNWHFCLKGRSLCPCITWSWHAMILDYSPHSCCKVTYGSIQIYRRFNRCFFTSCDVSPCNSILIQMQHANKLIALWYDFASHTQTYTAIFLYIFFILKILKRIFVYFSNILITKMLGKFTRTPLHKLIQIMHQPRKNSTYNVVKLDSKSLRL